MTKIEEILAATSVELAANEIEDTPFNRLRFLYGMLDAWLEEGPVSPLKDEYVDALRKEIHRLIDELVDN